MSAELEARAAPVPEVPSVLRLGWMLFMQPIRLHHLFKALGLDGDPSVWKLRHRLRAGDPTATALLRRFAVMLFLGMPAATFAVAGLPAALGVSVTWTDVAVGVGRGMAFGVAFGVAFGAARGVAVGVSVGVASGMVGAIGPGMAGSVASGVGFGVTFAVAFGVWFTVAYGVAIGVVGGVAGGAAGGVVAGVAVDVAAGVAIGVAVIVLLVRIPSYFAEALWTMCASATVRLFPALAPHFARWLPFRHHDLIHFPLPLLRCFLVTLADQDPVLSRSLIDEASATIAQKTPARRALIDLQARALERAARDRLWARTAALDLPFLPNPADLDETSPLTRFQRAAQDLHAARLSTDHLRRRNALERANAKLASYRTTLVGKPRLDDLERRLVPTTRLWQDIIDDDLRALTEEERANPQIPTPFEPGPPLGASDAHLFKGRTDLIRLIDHDLADHRRAPLLLTGQRRMGKTSLLRMLPERLGTGTTIVSLNFQKLSGSPHREHPHRWLAEALAAARPALSAKPPADAAWNDTLAWLEQIEPELGKDHILLAIDEIERIQTGIDEGWTSPAFLDFLRAAGDSLRNIRILLVSAHPLHRLGRAWTDRLISVIHRDITYLLPAEAEDLIRNPMPGFPDIYPPGGIDRIVRETRGHPYLVQLVCDALVRDLNGRRKLTATDADLTRALDRALGDTPLFRELWQDRTDEERALLRRLGEGASIEESSALRALAQEGYVEGHEVAVPLFATWIRERA